MAHNISPRWVPPLIRSIYANEGGTQLGRWRVVVREPMTDTVHLGGKLAVRV